MTPLDRPALPSGTALDGLVIDGVIGVGGFGLIYGIRDTAQAVKEFFPLDLACRAADGRTVEPSAPDRAEAFRRALDRFRDEARTIMTIAHPAIVPVERLFETNGTAYMVMPLIEGESLGAVIEREAPIAEDRLLSLAAPILEGIAAVHRHGFLHRDIKPANIRIRADGSPVLLDFGSAGPVERRVSRPRQVSPGYSAPEQYVPDGEEGPWTDLYAIAAVLYHAVAGRAPLPADERAAGGEMELAVDAGLLRYGRAVLQSIDSALALSAAARPASAGEFLGMLEGRIGPFGSVTAPVRPRAPRPGAALTGGVGLLAVAVAAVILGGTWHSPGDGPKVIDETRNEAHAPRHRAGSRVHDCPDCPVLVVLPPGDVALRADPTALPVPVRITRAFAIGVFEVTRDQYAAFMADSGRETQAGCGVELRDGVWRTDLAASWRRPGFEHTALHPAVCVSWDDAVAYTEWLSRKTRHNYRLPTEAEWEYAARAGAGSAYWWGASADEGEANCADCEGAATSPAGTMPVGSFAPNRFGLMDVHGNAAEWLQDCWNDSHFDRPDEAHARTDGDCRRRVLRGGHWAATAKETSFLAREGHFSDLRTNRFGFRVVRDIEAAGAGGR